MAFKLTKEQIAEHERVTRGLLDGRRSVEEAFEKFREVLRGLQDGINLVIADYNKAVRAKKALASTILEDHEDAYEDKSDRWKESDRGQAALAFIEAWQAVVDADELDEVYVLLPDPPTFAHQQEAPTEADS